MKRILFFLCVALSLNVNAQNLGKKYDFLNTIAERIPTKSGVPFYDTTVKLSKEFDKDKIENNISYFFANVFGSDMVKKNGKSSYLASGAYSFVLENSNEDPYNVTYWFEISYKDGRFDITMHDFQVTHNSITIDLKKKMEGAAKTDNLAKHILANLHAYNVETQRKAIRVISSSTAEALATAGR